MSNEENPEEGPIDSEEPKDSKKSKKENKKIKALESQIEELKALVSNMAKSGANANISAKAETKVARKRRTDAIEKKQRYDGSVKPGFGGVPKKPLGKPVMPKKKSTPVKEII